MAKQIFTEVDNSKSVQVAGSMVGAIVVASSKGQANTPIMVDSESDLIEKFGKPDITKSPTMYSALAYLQKIGGLLVTRAVHTAPDGIVENEQNMTARFSSALVRGKITPIPNDVPDMSYQPERVVEPYTTPDGLGLKQSHIDGFTFPVYSREREYEQLKKVSFVREQTNTNKLVVNDFGKIKEGSRISLGETADNETPVFFVAETKSTSVRLLKIVASKPQTIARGTKLRRVIKEDIELTQKVSAQTQQGSTQITLKESVEGTLQSGDTIWFNGGTDATRYVVQTVSGTTITLRTALKSQVEEDAVITHEKRTYTDYGADYTNIQAEVGSTEILMNAVDLIGNTDTVTFETGLTNDETEFKIKEKGVYIEEQNQIILDQPTTVQKDTKIHLMIASEFEQKDVLLVHCLGQGSYGDNISIRIYESNDYPDTARFIEVVENGVSVEKFECTFEPFVDGLGKQLYVEDVINGKSAYIKVIHNKEIKDSDGKPVLPLLNDYALWRESPEDIFSVTAVSTTETLTAEETDIRVSESKDFSIGDRIKFGDYPQEYKITGKSIQQVGKVSEHHITIDRGIQVDTIATGTLIKKFTRAENKRVQKIDSVYFAKPNNTLTISGKQGILLDAGGNLFAGGNEGSAPDVGDFILAVKNAYSKREEINANLLLSGGIYAPAYADVLTNIAETRGDCFACLSNDPTALDSNDPVKATLQFRADLGINNMRAALFADWGYAYDPYTKRDVLISMDGISAGLQAFNAEGGIWGVPSAGWNSGKVFYIKKLKYTWTEEQRERLLNAQINPVKFDKTRGLSVWGNKTLYGARSFMQARNVAFIFIQMRIEIREYLEDKHFEVQDADSRADMVRTLEANFTKFYDVVNKLQVLDTTTPADEDNNRCKIYLSFTPKGLAEDFYTTLAVDSNAQSLSEA